MFLLLKNRFNKILRYFFWLIKLTKSDLGKNIDIDFPIIREGRGKLRIGNNAKIDKLVNLGVGNKGKLIIGSGCVLESKCKILVNNNINFLVGDNFKLGEYARLFVNNNWIFGNNVKIETYCSVFAREPDKVGVLSIGDGSHIGDYTIIDVVDNVSIGKEVAIGPNCTLYTHDHIYKDKNVPAWKGGLISKPIVINDGAWVGSGVTILPGVVVGGKCVIAAGSVVTKSTEANSIYGGIPAKLIKKIPYDS